MRQGPRLPFPAELVTILCTAVSTSLMISHESVASTTIAMSASRSLEMIVVGKSKEPQGFEIDLSECLVSARISVCGCVVMWRCASTDRGGVVLWKFTRSIMRNNSMYCCFLPLTSMQRVQYAAIPFLSSLSATNLERAESVSWSG